MPDVPMLGRAARRRSVVFLFLEVLDRQPVENRIELSSAQEGDPLPADPAVAVSQQLPGKSAARPEGGDDAPPKLRKPVWRTEGQCEAGVDEVGSRPVGSLGARDERLEPWMLASVRT